MALNEKDKSDRRFFADMRKITNRLSKEISEGRCAHLEAFAAAYIKLTDIPPQDAVLVQQMSDNKIIWRFEHKDSTNPQTIKSLEALAAAAQNRQSVICPGSWLSKPRPAAFVINLPGAMIYKLILGGLYIYQPKRK